MNNKTANQLHQPPNPQQRSPRLTRAPQVSRSPHIPRSNEEKVDFLCRETGIEHVMAIEFLGSNGWDLNEAIRGYRALVAHEEKLKKIMPPPPQPPPQTQEQANSLEVKVDPEQKRKVSRGFSSSNFKLLEEERSKQKQTVEEVGNKEDGYFEILHSSSRTSFVLPDISMYEQDFNEIVKQDLISKVTLQILTTAGRLNWWSEVGACRKLFPMSTVGDGNCLLHAVSLGMWGFHDRMLSLRKALYKTLQQPCAKKGLKRRWKYDLWRDNMRTGGLTYTLDEWEEEWDTIVKLSSDKPRSVCDGQHRKARRISRQTSFTGSVQGLEEGESLDSLEAIHVYVLANLLCRPIIVIAEEMLRDHEGNDIAPIPFGGIYLPLERDPNICYKYPLVLAYETSHFSALVPADGDNLVSGEKVSSSVPLVDRKLYLLPVKFAIDPGSTWDMVQDDGVKEEKPELTFSEKIALLRKYLDVVKVSFTLKGNGKHEKDYRVGSVLDHVHDIFKGQNANMLISAKLNVKNRPKNYKEMIDNFLENVKEKVREKRAAVAAAKTMCKQCTKEQGSPSLNGACRLCYEKEKQKGHHSKKPNVIGGLLQRSMAVNDLDNAIKSCPPSPQQDLNSKKSATTTTVPRSGSNSLTEGFYRMTIQDPNTNPPMDRCANNNSEHSQQERNTIHQSNQPPSKSASATKQSPPAPVYATVRPDIYENPSFQQIPSDTNYSSANSSPTVPPDIRGPTLTTASPSTPDEEYKRIGIHCRVSGCKFYGNKETLGFCSGCYRQYNKGMLK